MKINLLPPQLRKEEENFPWAGALLVFATALVCTFLLVLGWAEVNLRRKQLILAQEASVQAEKLLKEQDQAQKRLNKLQVELGSWQTEQKRSRACTDLLAQLRWRVPENAWLTRLTLRQDGELELTGGVLNLASLSRFLKELEYFPLLQTVTLLRTENKAGYYTFKLQAQLGNLPVERGREHGEN